MSYFCDKKERRHIFTKSYTGKANQRLTTMRRNEKRVEEMGWRQQ